MFRVRLLSSARADLKEIWRWISEHDSKATADYVFNNIVEVAESLKTVPLRGRVPDELREIGEESLREVIWKPYRIVYEVRGKDVFVLGVFDGRRDLRTAYERRFMR